MPVENKHEIFDRICGLSKDEQVILKMYTLDDIEDHPDGFTERDKTEQIFNDLCNDHQFKKALNDLDDLFEKKISEIVSNIQKT